MKEDMVGEIYSRHEEIRNSCNVLSGFEGMHFRRFIMTFL
jgi:hypothetical protein